MSVKQIGGDANKELKACVQNLTDAKRIVLDSSESFWWHANMKLAPFRIPILFAAILIGWATICTAQDGSTIAEPREMRPEDRYDERDLGTSELPPWSKRAAPSARKYYKEPGMKWDRRTRRWVPLPYLPYAPSLRLPNKQEADKYQRYRSPFNKSPSGRTPGGYQSPRGGR